MRTFFLLIKAALVVVVFLLLFGFVVKNLDSVAVRFFLGLEWHLPLVLVLLAFFTTGIVLGLMASVVIIVGQRRQIVRLKRELRGLTRAAVAPVMAEPV